MDFNNCYVSGNRNKCSVQIPVSYLCHQVCQLATCVWDQSSWHRWAEAASACVTRLGAVADWRRSWPMANMLIMGHPRESEVVPLDSTVWFPIINCTRGRILHRFRRIAVDMSKITAWYCLQRSRIACNAERCNSYCNSVCPSVCLSVCHTLVHSRRMKIGSCGLHCKVAKHSSCLIPPMVGGQRPLPPKICAQSDPPSSEKHRLRPISAYNVWTVRTSEKSSIIANRKSATRFQMSYIRSS